MAARRPAELALSLASVVDYMDGMVWYGIVIVDLYSAIITKVSNALNTVVSGEKPGFQTLSDS